MREVLPIQTRNRNSLPRVPRVKRESPFRRYFRTPQSSPPDTQGCTLGWYAPLLWGGGRADLATTTLVDKSPLSIRWGGLTPAVTCQGRGRVEALREAPLQPLSTTYLRSKNERWPRLLEGVIHQDRPGSREPNPSVSRGVSLIFFATSSRSGLSPLSATSPQHRPLSLANSLCPPRAPSRGRPVRTYPITVVLP